MRSKSKIIKKNPQEVFKEILPKEAKRDKLKKQFTQYCHNIMIKNQPKPIPDAFEHSKNTHQTSKTKTRASIAYFYAQYP